MDLRRKIYVLILAWMFVKLGLIYITGKIKNFVKNNNIKVDIYYSLNITPFCTWNVSDV
jgi:hypothetical protein